MKIVITDWSTVSGGDLPYDPLKKFGEVQVYDLTDYEEVPARIADADMILCNKTRLDRSNLQNAENLKYIGLFATGYNNIDADYCRERGIAVCNAPSYSTDSVAQLTFALILELADRVRDYRILVDKGDWIKSRSFSCFPIPLMELKGKTLGVIGFGSIGSKVAEIALAFGMNVLAFNRSPKAFDGVSFTDLKTLLQSSDIVSLHCPLNKDSEKLINADTIAMMKDGAYLINTARGAVVDESAAAEALNSGKLGGMGTDVLQTEPMREDCPLYRAKNCVITPHIAWAGLETRQRLMKIVEDNIAAFLDGNTQNNVAK